MDAEEKAGLAAARRKFGDLLNGRDFVELVVWTSDASEDLGAQPCELFKRTVIAPRGAAERLVEGAEALCNRLDPAGGATFPLTDEEDPA